MQSCYLPALVLSIDSQIWNCRLRQVSQTGNPSAAIFHGDLADVLAQKGDDAEAKAQYLAALKAKPDLDTANLGLGVLLARAGDRPSSKFYCAAALKSSDNDIRQQARECLSAK